MKALVLLCALAGLATISPGARAETVILDSASSARERYAASRLKDALAKAGVLPRPNTRILVGTKSSSLFAAEKSPPAFPEGASEAFQLKRAGADWLVIGSDPSGVLDGCLELARRIRNGSPPA
jgi:hypothetical protein